MMHPVPDAPSTRPVPPHLATPARGVPAWAGLRTSRAGATGAFYERLLGWTLVDHGDGLVAQVDGRPVAMIAPGSGWDAGRWSCFFAAADLAEEGERLGRLGGRLITAPRTTDGIGRSALAEDPQGAAFGLMEPEPSRQAPPLDAPGSLRWCELDTADPAASRAFYGALFGYEPDETRAPTGAAYTRLLLDGRPVAGLLAMDADWPAAVPPRWLPYFAVADVPAAAARVVELGGAVAVGPLRSRGGELLIGRDPEGVAFGLARAAGEASA